MADKKSLVHKPEPSPEPKGPLGIGVEVAQEDGFNSSVSVACGSRSRKPPRAEAAPPLSPAWRC